MTKRKENVTSNEVIGEDFWYSAPERKYLLLGKTRFAEVDAAYAAMSDDERDAFRSEIPLLSSIRWSGRFLELKAHLAATGGIYPTTVDETRVLFDWVHRNRKLLNQGSLPDERKAILDELDTSWHVGVGYGSKINRGPRGPRGFSAAWEQRLEEYASFVSRNGRTPSEYSEDAEERSLQKWMINQKSFMHERSDAAERIALMNEVLPGCFDEKRKRMDWDDALELFTAFVSNHKRFPSADSGTPDEIFIGRWIRAQRESRTAQRDSRHAERTAKLDAVFPAWRDINFFSDQEWEEKLELLAAHVKMTGRMPTSGIAQETRLASWRLHQVSKLKNSRLRPERRMLLDAKVPGWSDKVQRSQLKAIRDLEPTVND